MIAYFLKNIKSGKVLMQKNSNKCLNVASLIKVLYALEVVNQLNNGLIANKSIIISSEEVEDYGTDVLSDLVNKNNLVNLDIMTLVGLMLKYSCNSSTKIIADKFLSDRKLFQTDIHKKMRLDKTILINDHGEVEAKSSLKKLSVVFETIYSKKDDNFLYVQKKMKESRNIYYLFDNQNIKVLGSKSGTVLIDGVYWVSNCGVVDINSSLYFVGSVVSNKEIFVAVNTIRKLGSKMIACIRKNGNIH